MKGSDRHLTFFNPLYIWVWIDFWIMKSIVGSNGWTWVCFTKQFGKFFPSQCDFENTPQLLSEKRPGL